MNILVTGGHGFIGSHIVDALLEARHKVTILDNREAGITRPFDGLTGNSTRPLESLEPGALADRFDYVVHAAARADIPNNWVSTDERDRLWRCNVAGTTALLEAIGRTPIVFLSTCAVYGDDANCSEETPCVATSPYAASKLAGEALVQAYSHRWESKDAVKTAPWTVLRLSCVVGARYHHGHIADFVRMARADGIKARNSGWAKKSFVHVADVVDAVTGVVAGQILPRHIYNVAAGTWNPRDTVLMMRPSIEPEWQPDDVTHGWIGDPMAIAHSHKLRAAGWAARRTVAAGVADALESLGWT